MKKRILLSILFSIIVAACCAVSAIAAPSKSMPTTRTSASSIASFIKLAAETDAAELKKYSQSPDPIGQFKQDLGDGTFLRDTAAVEEIGNHMAVTLRDAYDTYNSTNKEFGKIGRQTVEGSQDGKNWDIRNIAAVRTAYPSRNQNDPDYIHGKLLITPLYILKDANGRLHVICDTKNVTGQSLEFYGLDKVEVRSGDKVIASGEPKLMANPIVYSSLPLDKDYYGSNKIIDGYATGGFLDIVFEPGTYDDTVNVSSLDDILFGFSNPVTKSVQ